MDRIVTKPMKIDFHIHSCFSKFKDEPSLVEEGKIENLDTLLKQLEINEINLCAITDHDYFSYDLYSKLKSYEKECGKLKKVFPGVEFSVGLKAQNNTFKQIHVICIFDDENNEKVKNIAKNIPFKDGKIDYGVDGQQYFSEEKFISILRDIDLNVITIAHQKQSITSGSADKSKNDVSSLGPVKFNELISCEYFESFEFKNMKNGMFNNNYAIQKNKNYDQIRFITGSDCHDWKVYPKHDSSENDDIGFEFTFLKCLPSFRGLAMAFSDTRRITTKNHIFSPRNKSLEQISLSINGNNYEIPLSLGINVIIGDNSIGKSLLLHKITNYNYLLVDNKNNVKGGYERYLKNNNINIETSIEQSVIHTFDYQGGIRDKFSKDSQDNSDFLADKFPEDINVDSHKTIILSEFEKLYDCINKKFIYDDNYKKLNTLTMIDEEVSSKSLTVKSIKNNQDKIKKHKNLYNYYNNIIAKIDVEYNLIEEDDEKRIIDDFKTKLVEFKTKYENLLNKEKNIYAMKNGMNVAIKKFNGVVEKWKSELEAKKNRFDVEDSVELARTIAELVKIKKGIKPFTFKVKKEEIKPEILEFGKYLFIKKLKNCSSIDENYLQGVLERVLKNNVKIDTVTITKDVLKDSISNFGDGNNSAVNVLKEKIETTVEGDLESVPSITMNGTDVYSKLSNGMNSSIYFDILSTDKREGIYIVDQPEDDISQNGIKSNVLNNFKTMANSRQIIMITHNPQFVVNLDADNVICIAKDNEDNLC